MLAWSKGCDGGAGDRDNRLPGAPLCGFGVKLPGSFTRDQLLLCLAAARRGNLDGHSCRSDG